MALGKPVVSTAAGGPLEIVKNGETGLLVPPGDAGAMANAINALLSDPELRLAVGKKGLIRFQQKFTARAMACATLAVYERATRAPLVPIPTIEEKKCEFC
jgi:glycosyltransferase involved in cell wall biosynthesis